MNTARLLDRIVQDWAAASPGTDAVTMRRCILLKQVAGAVADEIERVHQQHGLNHALADLLFTLYRSAPPEGMTPGELTELAAVTPSSITHRIDRVVQEGLVERTTDPHDARSRRIRLTPAGRASVEAHLPAHVSNEQHLLSGLTPDEQQTLEDLLLKLVGHLEHRTGER
ncbi:MarR family transcriptional regulator [Deinococcus cavernae]|uniref:MarR family transcriptional regulator n=1 Tax=Deinococcus cavernae TaxID=2320857 RepID=A0A418V998_9DEIO|nr:MarR family transcriptional regulator [Deinococcus cavernae]RJF72694.1 MarR family transcriptional regulator [Deinococcus cavernae]